MHRPSLMTAVRGKLGEMDIDRDPFAPTPPPGQDVLPSDDGEPMESSRHLEQMTLLIHTLRDAWSERQDFYVAGNMFVYFSELQTKGPFVGPRGSAPGPRFRGPDVFVVLDTEKKSRKCWVTWEEGGKLPNVVIELLSPSTEKIDRGEKMRLYSRVWRTPEYLLYDPFSHVLEGYALVQGEYVAIAKDAGGDVPSHQLGLALGVRDGDQPDEPGPFLRWIDAEGRALPTRSERVAELEAALRAR